jgi:hypothetical protein
MSEISYKISLEFTYEVLNVLSSGELSSSTDYELISFLYNNCGVVCIRLGWLDEALKYFNTVKNLADKHLPDNQIGASYSIRLAQIYFSN